FVLPVWVGRGRAAIHTVPLLPILPLSIGCPEADHGKDNYRRNRSENLEHEVYDVENGTSVAAPAGEPSAGGSRTSTRASRSARQVRVPRQEENHQYKKENSKHATLIHALDPAQHFGFLLVELVLRNEAVV